MNNLRLPDGLEPFRSILEETSKPFIKLNAKKSTTSLFQSKFSGHPYLPKGENHPFDSYGKPMKLLAQINFEETPKLENFPDKGILQFFVSVEDELSGVDFDDLTNQENFRVIYHENIIKDENLLITNFDYMDDLETDYFPIQSEDVALTFTPQTEPVSVNDFQLKKMLVGKVDFDKIVDVDGLTVEELYFEHFSGDGHKIGGYPFFTQYDPREDDYEDHTILLLQIDTDDKIDCMWGDAGVCNFFIKKEDLLKKDFSNVVFTWDCY